MGLEVVTVKTVQPFHQLLHNVKTQPRSTPVLVLRSYMHNRGHNRGVLSRTDEDKTCHDLPRLSETEINLQPPLVLPCVKYMQVYGRIPGEWAYVRS